MESIDEFYYILSQFLMDKNIDIPKFTIDDNCRINKVFNKLAILSYLVSMIKAKYHDLVDPNIQQYSRYYGIIGDTDFSMFATLGDNSILIDFDINDPSHEEMIYLYRNIYKYLNDDWYYLEMYNVHKYNYSLNDVINNIDDNVLVNHLKDIIKEYNEI